MNQPGKDPQIGQDLRTLYGEDQAEDHVIVPIPKSYEAAMTIALQVFAENIHAMGMDTSDGMSLRYRMKESSGKVIWARIIPEFWNEVVEDGDRLRLASKASESQTEVSSVFGTLIGNRQLVDPVGSSSILVLLPKTYQRTKALSIAKFNIPQETIVQLYMRIKTDSESEQGTLNGWTAIDPNIGSAWPALLAEIKNQYSKVEIWVREI
ncbi:hypothetical protein GALMADRAFT_147318 [Galerina marginata CBS 339.88]|uniref:Uncharacterized protein n=1 Tax=Galerina marginata (strain CBS 339.88) TaxID=685588 RepID=A0A067SAU2_GALM3|nr:hypothetical protein GALMADRAFT_147318 [Galerina marginata CBS 339.88]